LLISSAFIFSYRARIAAEAVSLIRARGARNHWLEVEFSLRGVLIPSSGAKIAVLAGRLLALSSELTLTFSQGAKIAVLKKLPREMKILLVKDFPDFCVLPSALMLKMQCFFSRWMGGQAVGLIGGKVDGGL